MKHRISLLHFGAFKSRMIFPAIIGCGVWLPAVGQQGSVPLDSEGSAPMPFELNTADQLELLQQEGNGSTESWVLEAAEEQTENLDRLRQHPLDLNRDGLAALEQCALLLPHQAEAILRHRERYGDFASVYELQSLTVFSFAELRTLIPYVSVSNGAARPREHWSRQLFGGDRQFLLRYSTILETQQGYRETDSNTAYIGNRARVYARYRYTYGSTISYGVTMEKDPGEPFFGKHAPKGFDFYSGHFRIRDKGRLSDLCLGDYSLRWGQGLVWWSGFGTGKGAGAVAIQKSGRPMEAYTATDENRFLRGTAVRWRLGPAILSAFGSYKHVDANYWEESENGDTLSSGTDENVRTLLQDGLHRTLSEQGRRDALGEWAAGVHLGLQKQWDQAYAEFGLLASHLGYQESLVPGDALYQQFDGQGNANRHLSGHYQVHWKNSGFYGETALSSGSGFATLNGWTASLHPRLDLSLLHRHYSRSYTAPYSAAFSERSETGNEQGFYCGLRWQLANAWTLEAYADQYRFPWLRYGADAPSDGREMMVLLQLQPRRETSISCRFRREIQKENAPDSEAPQDYLENTGRYSVRCHIATGIRTALRWQGRMEWVWHREGTAPPGRGVLLYQDIQWKSTSGKFSVSARYTLWDVESFDARIYTYENDVLYAFSLPFFSDRGSRYYTVLHWRINRLLDAYARFARTHFANRETIGSAGETIEAPHRSELKLMLRLQW